MKRIVVQTLLLFMCIPSFSQERISSAELDRRDSFSAKEVSFSSKNDKVTVQYILQENAYVELYVSLDGGENYYGPLNELSGASGNLRKSRVIRFIYWNPVKEYGGIESDAVTFRVVTSPQEDRTQLKREKSKKVSPRENAIWAGLNAGYIGLLRDYDGPGHGHESQRWFNLFHVGTSIGINNIAASRFGSFVTVDYGSVLSDTRGANLNLNVSLGVVYRIADRWNIQIGPTFCDLRWRPQFGALLGTSYLLSQHLLFSLAVSASGNDFDIMQKAQIGISWLF